MHSTEIVARIYLTHSCCLRVKKFKFSLWTANKTTLLWCTCDSSFLSARFWPSYLGGCAYLLDKNRALSFELSFELQCASRILGYMAECKPPASNCLARQTYFAFAHFLCPIHFILYGPFLSVTASWSCFNNILVIEFHGFKVNLIFVGRELPH